MAITPDDKDLRSAKQRRNNVRLALIVAGVALFFYASMFLFTPQG